MRAGLDWLEREFNLPMIFAGFSFGAAIGLRVACPDHQVKALISLGTPVAAEGRVYTLSVSCIAAPNQSCSSAEITTSTRPRRSWKR